MMRAVECSGLQDNFPSVPFFLVVAILQNLHLEPFVSSRVPTLLQSRGRGYE